MRLLDPFVQVTGGFNVGADVGRDKDFIIGKSSYDYKAEARTQIEPIWGALVGVEMPLPFYQNPHFRWQTGVSYYQSGDFRASGNVTQGVDPMSSDTFPYHYKLISRQVLWENKLLTKAWEHYYPYVSVGLGAAFNQTEGFDVTFPEFLTYTPLYDGKTESSFSYNLGVGIDMDITDDWRIGLGYRFTDLGKNSLGDGELRTTTVTESLGQSHLYGNEFLLQISYFL